MNEIDIFRNIVVVGLKLDCGRCNKDMNIHTRALIQHPMWCARKELCSTMAANRRKKCSHSFFLLFSLSFLLCGFLQKGQTYYTLLVFAICIHIFVGHQFAFCAVTSTYPFEKKKSLRSLRLRMRTLLLEYRHRTLVCLITSTNIIFIGKFETYNSILTW